MISIVIRNKNEASSLKRVLTILYAQFSADFDEVILVDNNSTDNSIAVAESFGAKVIIIKDFTYGKASNLGVSHAMNNFVLLLSAHSVPIGNSFFKSSISTLINNKNIAGIRYINSISNYERAVENGFVVKDGLNFGLMTACAMINKNAWNTIKFDENLPGSEDKKWSVEVLRAGYEIIDIPETYFYFPVRNRKANLLRLKNETIAEYKLNKKTYPSRIKLIIIFIFNCTISNTKYAIEYILNEFKLLKLKFSIYKELKH